MSRRWLHIFVFMALALGLGTAQAAWTYMGHLDGHAVLIDRSSIQLKKRNALVWMLTNYSTPTSQQLLSSTTYLEFDCDKNKVRYLLAYGYEGQMQSGARLISVVQPGGWEAVAFGTIIKSFEQIACVRGPFIRPQGELNKPPK
ncbi:MAG: hypothetical protein HQ455_07350 [Burkholderiales bacterium]|nr:hypothetical protein [Burkholderiales bacterium]